MVTRWFEAGLYMPLYSIAKNGGGTLDGFKLRTLFAVPKAEEKISYGIPTFTLNGKYLIYFAGWKHHISIYPIPVGDEALNQEIAPYVSGKGTLKFPIGKPMPLKLITKIVKLKVAESLTGSESKKYSSREMET